MNLVSSGRDILTVFDLLGSKENDMTFSLGWVLSRSSHFLKALLSDLCGDEDLIVESAAIRLQTGRRGHGITDIEIDIGQDVAVIIEAKKGPELPSISQLGKYACVLNGKSAANKVVAALTNASPAASSHLRCPGLTGKQLQHRSWREIRSLARTAAKLETHENKRWLRSFVEYLGGLLEMEMRFSNKVYVVSLGGHPEGWSISFRDVVEKKKRYFFPVGSGWPDPPPNYIGFRYDGQLQSIHHVSRYDTFTRPHELFKEAAADIEWPLHYCAKLGPAIRPPRLVKNGPQINRSARVYCLIDTLLTNKTISDALAETKARMNAE
jgi:hypothetical protein